MSNFVLKLNCYNPQVENNYKLTQSSTNSINKNPRLQANNFMKMRKVNQIGYMFLNKNGIKNGIIVENKGCGCGGG